MGSLCLDKPVLGHRSVIIITLQNHSGIRTVLHVSAGGVRIRTREGGGGTLQGEGAQHALGPWYTRPSQRGQSASLRSSCQQPFGGPRHTPGSEQSGRGMRHILSPKCIKIVGQVTSPNARQTNNWGGGNWEHPNIGTAKFGAEEIWPQF